MRIQRFGHAGIEVGDLAAAEAFYRDVFGFEVAARFPEDGEIMFAVGEGDHLLLHGGAASAGHRAPETAGGLHHAAFQLVEGHREIESARRRLEELGVDFQRVDHDGDPSVYFRDPDGNVLELYAAQGSSPRFGSAAGRLAAAGRFVHGTARLIDRVMLEHARGSAGVDQVLSALTGYRNPDGGFGHGLEPDVRAPASQPIHVITALELLHEAGIRSPELADDCCTFLAGVADAGCAMPALLPGALDFPAAPHWQGPFAFDPALGWTIGAVAQLAWHGCTQPWFYQARQICLDTAADAVSNEAHQLLYLSRFAGEVMQGAARDELLAKCREALSGASLFVAETPVARYGLTPLHYAPAPGSPMRGCFDDELIEAHLDDLLDAQQGDGGWPIRFTPPGGVAAQEWRGRWTLEALAVLTAYGRL